MAKRYRAAIAHGGPQFLRRTISGLRAAFTLASPQDPSAPGFPSESCGAGRQSQRSSSLQAVQQIHPPYKTKGRPGQEPRARFFAFA